jgi:shikimate dehydrogenase
VLAPDLLPSATHPLIDGHTRLVPLLAYPSEHVRTPALFNSYCAGRGLNAVMFALKVSPSHLQSTWQSLRTIENLAGVVITIPHKAPVASLVDSLEGAALHMGVCNVARRSADGSFVGRMYDGVGFVAGLASQGIEIRGRRAALFGAGGAGTAIAHALCHQGLAHLHLINRTPAKAEALARELAALYPNVAVHATLADPSMLDLAINGTALGLHAGDALPFDPATLGAATVVAEVVMQPDTTALLQRASDLGLRVHRGIHMVQTQVQLLAEFVLAPHG